LKTAQPKSDRQTIEDARAILNAIRRLVRALRTFDKETHARYGVGAAQMFILHVLMKEPALSMNEVAERTATDQSSVSLAVGRLVEEGYVRRLQNEEDRRQVRLSLTPRGRALVRRSPAAAQERIMASAAALSARERAQLLVLMDKVLSGMGAAGGRAPMLFADEPTE
jgi:DNA-binding MarR family transcriptional regulator